MTTSPIKVEVTANEAEKFVRAMAVAGKVTTTSEVGSEAYKYSFHDGVVSNRRYYEAEIDYSSGLSSITIHVPKE